MFCSELLRESLFLFSTENGPQNLHFFSFAATSGNDCDEH